VAGNGELTGEACDAVKEDDVDGEDREIDGKTPHGRAPRLHMKEVDVRQPLIGDEHYQKKSSLMSDS
jgi:hypothetical protein